MAEAAKENVISKKVIEGFLDRYENLEDKASEIMIDAMNRCRTGPRADQKELRQEMKDAGIRMKTFNALWHQKLAERKAQEKMNALEDDDLDQMRQLASSLKGTPFGDLIAARIDEIPL